MDGPGERGAGEGSAAQLIKPSHAQDAQSATDGEARDMEDPGERGAGEGSAAQLIKPSHAQDAQIATDGEVKDMEDPGERGAGEGNAAQLIKPLHAQDAQSAFDGELASPPENDESKARGSAAVESSALTTDGVRREGEGSVVRERAVDGEGSAAVESSALATGGVDGEGDTPAEVGEKRRLDASTHEEEVWCQRPRGDDGASDGIHDGSDGSDEGAGGHFWCDSLEELHAERGRLSGLRTLDLSGCRPAVLPAELWSATGLQALSLSGCAGLVELPVGLGSLTGLHTLIMCDCTGLVALPAELGRLAGLTELDLSRCQSLKSLPKELGSLTGLHALNLSDCTSLGELSAELGSLAGLQTLDLHGCEGLEWIPGELGRLAGLQTLDLSGCVSLRVPVERAMPVELGLLAGLQTLNLSGCTSLRFLPAGMRSLTGLRTLELCGCTLLRVLPAGMGSLTGLQTLNLARCSGLGELPAELGKLAGLQTINLFECNGLVALPAELGLLAGLTELDLRNCQSLKSLPKELGSLTGLRKLNLSECTSLGKLPAELGSMAGLQTLILHGCKSLERIPGKLGMLVGLETLDLSYCVGLRELPAELGSLTNLEILNLRGCDELRRFFPGQILASAAGSVQQIRAVVDFLADLRHGKTVMDMVKIVLVGESLAGKSSLLDALESGSPMTKETKRAREDRTAGIDIRRWMPTREGTVVAQVYDAAGQKVYRATHGLCMSSGALYVLVVSQDGEGPERCSSNCAEESYCAAAVEEVWSWIEAVQVQAPGAFLAVVWTHVDLPSPVSQTEDPVLRAKKGVMEKVGVEMLARMTEDLAQLRSLEDQLRERLPLKTDWATLREKRDTLLHARFEHAVAGLTYRASAVSEKGDVGFEWELGLRPVFAHGGRRGELRDEDASREFASKQLKRLGRGSTLELEDIHDAMADLDGAALRGEMVEVDAARSRRGGTVVALPEGLSEEGRSKLEDLQREVAEARRRSELHFRPFFCTGVSNTTGYGLEGLHDILASVVENRELFPEIGTAMPISYGMLMHFAEGGHSGVTGDTGHPGGNLTLWERSVIEHVKTLGPTVERLRALCAKPFVTLEDLMTTAKECVTTATERGLTEGELASLPNAVRFLDKAGAVLLHGVAGNKTGGRVFWRPQWIVDAVKFVVREGKAGDVDKELGDMDVRIRDGRVPFLVKARRDLFQKGHLHETLLFTCLWGWPEHTTGAAKGTRKFPGDTHGPLLDVLRDFGLLRQCGDHFLVPAMLPERRLPDGFDIFGSWLPTEARAALKVLRRCFEVRALPGSFFSKLQLDWSVTEAQHEQHFVQEYVATFASRTASVLRRAEQHQEGEEAAVAEIVVVSMERQKGVYFSEIRVMGWVEFIGDEVSESSVGSTSWSLFREVTSAIRASARKCGISHLPEHIPILHPKTGEDTGEAWEPGGRKLAGNSEVFPPSFPPSVFIDEVDLWELRDNLIPPLEWWDGKELREMARPGARRVALRHKRLQTPSIAVAAPPVAPDAGAGAAARGTGVVGGAAAALPGAEASAEGAGSLLVLAGAASRDNEAGVDGGGHGGVVGDLRDVGDEAASGRCGDAGRDPEAGDGDGDGDGGGVHPPGRRERALGAGDDGGEGAPGKRARSSTPGGIGEQGGGAAKTSRKGSSKWDDREEEALRRAAGEVGTKAKGSWPKIHARMKELLGGAWIERTKNQVKQHWSVFTCKEKLANPSQLSLHMNTPHAPEDGSPAPHTPSNVDAAPMVDTHMEDSGELGAEEGGSAQLLSSNADADALPFFHLNADALSALGQGSEGAVRGVGDDGRGGTAESVADFLGEQVPANQLQEELEHQGVWFPPLEGELGPNSPYDPFSGSL